MEELSKERKPTVNMLIKGNERRVVIVKGKKDSLYEMACIFLKENIASRGGDIIKDAQEIICNAQAERIGLKKKKRSRFAKTVSFLLGLIFGIFLSVTVYLIFSASY
jgi:hypothetical protein